MPIAGPAAFRVAVFAAIWAGWAASGLTQTPGPPLAGSDQIATPEAAPGLPPPVFDRMGAGTPASRGGAPWRSSASDATGAETPSGAGTWPVTLNAAIALALRNSQVVRTVGGDPSSIAGTGFDPAIERQAVTAAEAAFDPTLSLGFDRSRINQPPNSVYGPGLSQPDRRNQATGVAALTKRWAAGTVTGVGFAPSPGYLYIPTDPRDPFNPLYSSNLEFTVRQPLLRGFGPAVNEAPIRIARINADQTSWDFRAATQQLVRGVEETYWELFAAGEAAAAAERSLTLAREIVRVQEERLAVERVVPADVSRARAEVFRFEQLAVEGRARAAVAEVKLRDLLGLPVGEGGFLVAASAPEAAPARPDRQAALAEAMTRRPDLLRRRMELERRSVELTVAENSRRPQLDLAGLYRANGVGNTLGDSIEQAGGFAYTDWTAGVTFSVPLGNRAAASNARAAELAIARERALLARAEQAVSLEIERLTREIEFTFVRYERAAWQARENGEWLRTAGARFADPPPEGGNDGWLTRSLTDLLLAMRTQAESEAEAAELLAAHGALLARLEEAKGTILERRAVEVVDGEGTPPQVPPAAPLAVSPTASASGRGDLGPTRVPLGMPTNDLALPPPVFGPGVRTPAAPGATAPPARPFGARALPPPLFGPDRAMEPAPK